MEKRYRKSFRVDSRNIKLDREPNEEVNSSGVFAEPKKKIRDMWVFELMSLEFSKLKNRGISLNPLS